MNRHPLVFQSLNDDEENFRAATLQEPLSQFRESSISGHILHLSTFRIFDTMWKIPQNPTKIGLISTPGKLNDFTKYSNLIFLKILRNEILISIFSQFSTLLHFDSKLNRASKETHITVQLCAKKLLCCRLVAKIGSFSNYMYCWFTELTTLQYTYRTAKQVLV